MDYILRIDVSKGEARKEKAAEEDRLMGGRGLSAVILNREVDPLCHPLGPGNKLVIAPGLLAGTMAPSFGRISVGGKSPLTQGIKEANAGGTAAQKLDRLGIKAIVVEGKPRSKEFSILKITGDGCEFLPAGDLAGKGNYDLVSALRERFGNKISVVSIGPAGEMRMSAASVAVTDADGRPTRHAARGGLGAVMGSKGLKAIVIDDSGTSRVEPRNSEAFQETVKGLVESLKADKGTPALNSFLGTPGVIGFLNKLGSMPTRNYHAGSFEQAQNIVGETIKEVNTRRGGRMHGCMPGCVIRCSIVFNNEDGTHLTSALEYETLTLLGANLGIGDLDAIARLDRLSDDTGLDTIEIGSAIAQAMEAGVIEMGDAQGALNAFEEVRKGTPLGRILGQGTVFAARAFGLDRVPAVLGQAIPAHDPRVCKPVGVTYATSPMGADHTAGIDYRDSLSREGQVKKSRQAQIMSATIDSVGYCMLAMPTKAPLILPIMASLLNARYGTNLTDQDVLQLGIKTIKEELDFNRRAGIDLKYDRIPEFVKTEPVPPQDAVFDIPRNEIEAIWQDL
ncbi:MAG: aldehyde ferredoxin oxidoreductase N-terminal domain-containing protein [Pseudomonadota bacterium]